MLIVNMMMVLAVVHHLHLQAVHRTRDEQSQPLISDAPSCSVRFEEETEEEKEELQSAEPSVDPRINCQLTIS